MSELEPSSWADFDTSVRSRSARVMGLVVRVSHPGKYQSFRSLGLLLSAVDNAVDEGSDFPRAREYVKSQWRFLDQYQKGNSDKKMNTLDSEGSFLTQELASIINALPDSNRDQFIHRYKGVLKYFHSDLLHRFYLKPYTQERLEQHRDNGFFQCIAAINIVLTGRDINDDSPFRKLTNIWAKSEPIADLVQDLEHGSIYFTPLEGAEWVNKLRAGNSVNIAEINSYLDSIKGQLAIEMFRLAPAAMYEIGGLIGFLMTIDFIKRSLLLKSKRMSRALEVLYGARKFTQSNVSENLSI